MDGSWASAFHFPYGVTTRKRFGFKGSLFSFTDEARKQARLVVFLYVKKFARYSIRQKVASLCVQAVHDALVPNYKVWIKVRSVTDLTP